MYQAFSQAKLTPNDRVYLNQARARLTTKIVMVTGGTFAAAYAFKMFRDRKRILKPRRWPFAIFASILVTIPAMVVQSREEYRRAIIDLDDTSYLRKYLFDAAVVTNPDLNAQQLYSKLAIEEYEQQQRNTMADGGQLPYNQTRRPPQERWWT